MKKDENFIHDKYGHCYYSIGARPVIFGLYTEPMYRRMGYAREHLQFVINKIRENGCFGEIEIEVKPRENSVDSEKLSTFYKSLGLNVLKHTKSDEVARRMLKRRFQR